MCPSSVSMAPGTQSCARACEVKMEMNIMKKYYFLGIMLAFCGPLMAVQGEFKAKVLEKGDTVKIELRDANDACVGAILHEDDINGDGFTWVGGFWINPLYRKTGIGKFLAVCVIADILTHYPERRVVIWRAISSGYMSGAELIGYYQRLGGIHHWRHGFHPNELEVDLDVIKKKNALFDFKKISDRIRSGASFSFNLSKESDVTERITDVLPTFCFDGAGNPILRSRL